MNCDAKPKKRYCLGRTTNIDPLKDKVIITLACCINQCQRTDQWQSSEHLRSNQSTSELWKLLRPTPLMTSAKRSLNHKSRLDAWVFLFINRAPGRLKSQNIKCVCNQSPGQSMHSLVNRVRWFQSCDWVMFHNINTYNSNTFLNPFWMSRYISLAVSNQQLSSSLNCTG